MGKLRIGLTISGAVSLGSFEGGALSALLVGIQALQARAGDAAPPILVDAIGAASAGSITAVATARVLTGGLDPVWVMQQAWVVQDSLQALLKKADEDAPLSMAGLRDMAVGILNGPPNAAAIQRSDGVTIHLALTCLRGLDYQIGRIAEAAHGRPPTEASTYLDWGRFDFKPGAPLEDFVEPPDKSPVDTALASGANEFGFPPKRLRRDVADYTGQELVNFPAFHGDGYLWYTDGGTVDNEPLGRTLSVTNSIDLNPGDADAEDRRLHLLIHPFPGSPPPPESHAWANGNNQPTWLRTLLRAGTIIREQNLYTDLRHAEKVNSRIVWRNKLESALAELIPAGDETRWNAALEGVISEIEQDLDSLPRHGRELPPNWKKGGPADKLRLALDRVADLGGRNLIGIEVVSPYLAKGTEGLSLDQILAGEFLESFGGFFHEGLRRSDFALGFVCMLNWMDAALGAYDVSDADAATAIEAALRAFYALDPWTEGGETRGFTEYGLSDGLVATAQRLGLQPRAEESWKPTDFGRIAAGDLPPHEQLLFARVAARVAHVVTSDLWRKFRHADTP